MLRTAAVLLILALPPGAGARGADYDAPEKRWREGPVRYLISSDEDKAYRRLKIASDRARFIQEFWARRDPDPATPENELRARFYKRVAAADRLFTETTKPGWKTDRGKIYILLGPPDELDLSRARNSIDPDVVLWVYREAPRGVGSGANSTIRFAKDASGEYRLSNRVLLSGFETPLGVGFQIQAFQMKSLPSPARALESLVASTAFIDPGPFHAHGDFFRSAEGRTFAVLTLGVRRSVLGQAAAAPDRMGPLARLVGDRPGGPSYDLTGAGTLRLWTPPEDRPDGAERRSGPDHVFFQAALPVQPGDYSLFFGILDQETGTLYPFRQALAVPALPFDRLTLGSLNLAARVERLPGPITSAYPAPFVVGGLRVTPRGDEPFHNGEVLAFYFQVHAPETDPIDARPDLDVEYQFLAAGEAGPDGAPVLVPLGNPIHLTRQRDQVLGDGLVLRDWRPGAYRLRVRVTDNLSGQEAAAESTFRVR